MIPLLSSTHRYVDYFQFSIYYPTYYPASCRHSVSHYPVSTRLSSLCRNNWQAGKENAEGYKASSAFTRANNLHGNLLLVHGMADDNVHFQNCAEYAEHLVQLGKQFDMQVPIIQQGSLSICS